MLAQGYGISQEGRGYGIWHAALGFGISQEGMARFWCESIHQPRPDNDVIGLLQVRGTLCPWCARAKTSARAGPGRVRAKAGRVSCCSQLQNWFKGGLMRPRYSAG